MKGRYIWKFVFHFKWDRKKEKREKKGLTKEEKGGNINKLSLRKWQRNLENCIVWKLKSNTTKR